MKTLQRQEQPAKAGMSPDLKKTASSPPPPPPGLELFTAGELDVAEQLVLLSGSSTSTGGTPKAGRGASVAHAAASGSSSPRSVNAQPAPAPVPAFPRGDGVEDEDEQEVPGMQRRTKRCRPIAEIYRATQRIGRCSLKKNEE
ncbi:uncharacterized protein LOC133897573 [Phragmites australis]|uniref:uncharacterized protein LOC133897573 n=1 Tax=Phragmites australis TaxID=29695 RepID=UPI002D7835FD|nr:uncharacterized protein LOC133897573 [Phragmites australis]